MMQKAFHWLDRTMEVLIVLIFAAMVVVGGMQVFNRFVLNRSLSWSEEFQKFAHIWLVFLTIPVGYNRTSHLGMETFIRRFPQVVRKSMGIFANLLWVVLGAAMVYYTAVIMRVARFQTSPGLGIRMDFGYLGLVIGGAYLLLTVLKQVILRRQLGSPRFLKGS